MINIKDYKFGNKDLYEVTVELENDTGQRKFYLTKNELENLIKQALSALSIKLPKGQNIKSKIGV